MALLVSSFCVYADYHVATYNTKNYSESKNTRVLVTGTGDDLGLLFHEVAKASALKYAQTYPDDQILIIAIEEKIGSKWSLERYGFKILRNEKPTFNAKILLKELARVQKIKSIDFFTHSTAQFGLHLNMRANPLNERTEHLSSIKSNFTKDAYVILHGCNNGFTLAPFLSRVWNLPVAGSLTSTNFQKLHSDGEFYLTGTSQYPTYGSWAKENNLSFSKEESCAQGACLRMRPENAPYVGFWGEYREGGLPFYKFFCGYLTEEKCLPVMAKSMLAHTLKINLNKNSSFEDYKKAVVDYLCPVSAKSNIKGQCEAELEKALVTKDYTYNPFSRDLLECDFRGCQQEIACKNTIIKAIPKPGSCLLKNTFTGKATTLVREYEAYLKAYPYLSL